MYFSVSMGGNFNCPISWVIFTYANARFWYGFPLIGNGFESL